ncbi:MAG: PepSY-associated TM helix domain-containing protein [Rheinheimera sp.]|nr:PepSY-associated TM helix domain-containing protein [Rheinheimera sp.]
MFHLRPWVRRLHLALALVTALIVSLVGLTGSLYVFAPEISAWWRPDLYQQAQLQATAGGVADIAALVSALELRYGQTIESLQWPYASRETFMLKLQQDPAWYFVDSHDASLHSDGGAYWSPLFELIYQIHSNLLLGDYGRYVTAGASLLFALLCVSSGMYLWWPAKRRFAKALTIHTSNRKRLNYDLHAVSGVAFSLPLLVMALTGAFYVFDGPMQRTLDWLLHSAPTPAGFWQKRFEHQTTTNTRLSTADAVRLQLQLTPSGMKPRNLWHSLAADGTYTFGYQARHQIEAGAQHRVFLQVNPYDGTVLRTADPRTLPLASRLSSQYLQPLHFGEFAGLPSRILWFVGGLVPLLLSITGLRIWLNRRIRPASR